MKILKEKNNEERLAFPDIKIYNTGTVIETVVPAIEMQYKIHS